jgi:TolB-like protein/Tfp pilus assembly protein PilF
MKRCPQCNRVENDDTLAFCRADGTALIRDSGSLSPDAGTVKFVSAPVSSEIETSILRNVTDASINRATAPTTVLPATQPPGKTRELGKPKRPGVVKSLAALAVVVAVVACYFFFSRRTNAAIQSIAVMPFVNASGNADVEYLSDGMTETLISSLSQLPNLNVKPRSSVFRYKGKETSSQSIGKELNVQAILNGRVIQRGQELSLFVELTDVALDKVVWSQQYNRKQTDLVSLQTEIARDVSSKLKSKLSGADAAKIEKTYTTNPEAYQLYLKGKFFWNKRTGESLKQAAELYRQAAEKDPNYALAYSGLAETDVLFSSYDVAPANDSMPQAKAAAQRALEIDDSLAEAHTALGFYLSNYEWDRDGSEKEYRRAIELKPNYATAHHWLGADLSNVKRFDDSLVELRRAEELDPLSPIIGTNLGDVLVFARRYDEAIAQYKRTLVSNPNFGYAHQALGWAYGLKGMYPEAIAETRTAIEQRNGSSAKGYLGLWLARSGKREEALPLLNELKQESARSYVQPYTFALIYIGLGDKTEALNWLEKQMLGHSETANQYAVEPELDDLRSEPRFKEMLKRMNLPE